MAKSPAESIVASLRSVTAKWTKQRKAEERHASARAHRRDRLFRQP
jgi:hypothetical protein